MATTVLPLHGATILHLPRRSSSLKYLSLRPNMPRAMESDTFEYFRLARINQLVRRSTALAATEGSAKSTQSDEKIPSWARPDSDEPPPWARESDGKATSGQSIQIPFYVYLLASAITAIAAIGSIFEYVNQRPVFGVISTDSMFYTPLLGFFMFTGIPTSAFLWFKSVEAANKEAEEQDSRDGFL